MSKQGRTVSTGSDAQIAITGSILESDRRSFPVQKSCFLLCFPLGEGKMRNHSTWLRQGAQRTRGFIRGSNFTKLNCVYRLIERYRRGEKCTLGFPKQRQSAAWSLIMTNVISSPCFHICNSCLKACSNATSCQLSI